jgi:hypothetical protein
MVNTVLSNQGQTLPGRWQRDELMAYKEGLQALESPSKLVGLAKRQD